MLLKGIFVQNDSWKKILLIISFKKFKTNILFIAHTYIFIFLNHIKIHIS